MSRRLIALASLLTLLGPQVSAWANLDGKCRDHVCLCVSHCPPRRAAGQDCHAQGAAGLRGACHQGKEPTLTPTTPGVLPAAAQTAPAWSRDAAPPPVDGCGRQGFATIDLPPPRAL